MQCSSCAKTVEAKRTRASNERLPRGWKRHQDVIYCSECWRQRYRLRAVTFPVLTGHPLVGGSQKELWEALHQAWAHTSRLANWAVTELAKVDAVRTPAMEKMPPLPKVNLYRQWNDQPHHERAWWDGAANSAAAILQAAQSKYLRRRHGVIWRQNEALPRHRYGVPFPVHNAAWSAAYVEVRNEERRRTYRAPAICFNLAGKRWQLALRGGPERRRQLAAFAQIVSGAAVQGELALYRRRSSQGAHRSGGSERTPGGGALVPTRLMAKLVAWLPQPVQERRRQGTLQVRTGHRALWVALGPEDQEPWLLHLEHLTRLIYRHRRRIQNLADDTKAERRRPARRRKKYQALLDTITYREQCRENAEYERASAWLASYADRRGFEAVAYDDRERRYCPELAWAKLRDLTRRKVEERGLLWVDVAASGEVAEEEDGPESDADPDEA